MRPPVPETILEKLLLSGLEPLLDKARLNSPFLDLVDFDDRCAKPSQMAATAFIVHRGTFVSSEASR